MEKEKIFSFNDNGTWIIGISGFGVQTSSKVKVRQVPNLYSTETDSSHNSFLTSDDRDLYVTWSDE